MSHQPTYDIEIFQNATFKMNVQLTDGSGSALNITSWSFSGSLKESFSSPDPAPINFNITVADVTQSILTISLLPTQSAQLTAPKYVYDVIATNISPNPDEIYRILQGKAKVYPGVTDI